MDSGQDAINGGNAQGIYSGANASGDVVLTPSGGLSNPKKRRGPLIIAIILIMIAIGAGVGAWIASQPRGGGGGNGSGGVSSNTLKGKFNIYANYVLFGKDSAEDFDYNELSDDKYYYMKDDLNIEEYVRTAQNKFDEFSELYYKDGGELNIGVMSVYFQGYISLRPFLTMDSVVNLYINNGYDNNVEMINDKYSIDDIDWNLSKYVVIKKNLALIWLNIASEAKELGCIKDDKIDEGCYKIPDDISVDMKNQTVAANNLAVDMLFEAIDAFGDVYKELYKVYE